MFHVEHSIKVGATIRLDGIIMLRCGLELLKLSHILDASGKLIKLAMFHVEHSCCRTSLSYVPSWNIFPAASWRGALACGTNRQLQDGLCDGCNLSASFTNHPQFRVFHN